MTYLDDLANDYQNTPGTVDLVHVAGGAETTGVKGNLLSDGPSYREIQGVAGLQSTDAVWLVWASTIPSRPRKGETLREADGTEWSVLTVAAIRESEPGRSLVIKWRCVCREKV